MRTSVLNVLLAMFGFGILMFAIPSLRYQDDPGRRALDFDIKHGEVLFFTADW